MKKLFILMAFLITGCGAVNASAMDTTTEYLSPQPTATISPVPTATIGYQATANVAETQVAIAQATADEANRVMVQATNDQAQREHETAMQNAQGTAQAESNHMIALGWTATAMNTSVPLTQTQQAIVNTQIPAHQTMVAAEIKATEHAPTQIVAESNARTQAQLAPLFAAVQIFAIFAIGVFVLFAAWFMRWYWMREDARAEAVAHAQSPQGVAERNGFTPIAQDEPEPEFIKPVEEKPARVERPITADTIRYTIPCAQNAFDIFAEKIITGEMALSINKWETSGFVSGANVGNVRAWIKRMRAWMHINGFGVFNENDEMTIVQGGREWLEKYLEHRTLPTEYQFGEAAQ